MTFKEVERLFYNKYPKGVIYKESTYNLKNNFEVAYNKSGKVYTYKVCNLSELCYKLGLIEYTKRIDNEPTLEELKENDDFGLFS